MSEERRKYKLTIDLIPSTVWFSSVFQILNERGERTKWQHIKEELFRTEGRQCWICRADDKRLEAHEFWEYDDKKHIQKLVSIHHLCVLCHMIKHTGFSCHTDVGQAKMARLGLTEHDLAMHFARINGCTEKDFKEHYHDEFEVWQHRSSHQWKQDFTRYI